MFMETVDDDHDIAKQEVSVSVDQEVTYHRESDTGRN